MSRNKTSINHGISFLMASTAAAQQQNPVGPGQGQQVQTTQSSYGTVGQTPWFSNQSIRQQINLNDEQFNRLNKSYGESYSRYQQGVTGLGTNLTPEQRSQRMQGLQHDFNKTFSTSTNDIITDPQARTRYNQLYLQYRGYDAFSDPMVQEKLNLTDQQRQQFNRYQQDWNQSVGDLNRTYVNDREGTTKRFNEMRQREQERMQGVLTDQQRQTWRQMTGDPYNFQADVYFQGSAGQNTQGTQGTTGQGTATGQGTVGKQK